MLFIVSAIYYNYKASDMGHYLYEMSVVGQENAYLLGKKLLEADNVISINIIDAMTGEVIENWEK